MKSRHQSALDAMNAALNDLYALDPSTAMTLIANAAQSAKRIKKRLTLSGELEIVEFVQSKGPTIEFAGKLLYEQKNDHAETELWLTQAGDWVLLNTHNDHARAFTFSGDEFTAEMVLIATNYAPFALDMAKKLGWSIRRDLD